ncbi:hypothetical protein [Persephonella sp. IF05-L8]|uniref:hypothetical protein n=1 Tax=Persephonella sp. IF05-L8 TaxID=1158338 RepID=UPI0004985250
MKKNRFKLFGLIAIFLGGIFLAGSILFFKKSNKPIILLVEDLSSSKDKDFQITRKAYKDLESFLSQKFPDFRFKHIPIYKEDKKNIRPLKNFLEKNKDKIVLIVANNSSSSHKLYYKYIPDNIPVITTIGSVGLIENSPFPLFSIYETSYSRALILLKLINSENPDITVFLYENPDTYTKEVWNFIQKGIPESKVKSINWKNISNLYPQIENKKIIFVIGESSTQTQLELFKKLTSKYKSNHYSIIFIRSFSSSINAENKIYSVMNTIPSAFLDIPDREIKRNTLLFCKKKQKRLSYNECLNVYSYNFDLGYEQTLVSLRDVNVEEKSIADIRKNIFKNLKRTNIENPYYNIFVFGFKKISPFSKNGYINQMLNTGIYPRFVARLDKKVVRLSDYQFISGEIPVVYLSMDIKKIYIEDISASSAYVEGYISIISVIDIFPEEDFKIDYINQEKGKINISLIKDDGKIKIYKFDGHFKINSKGELYNFPFDTHILEIKISPANFFEKPFYIQPFFKTDIDKVSINSVWSIIEAAPSFSLNYANVEYLSRIFNSERDFNSVSVIPTVSFAFVLERKGGADILIKYVLPSLILFIIALLSSFLIFNRNIDAKVDILVNMIIAIISIYFIFSLLISIDELIYIDYLYLIFIGTTSLFLLVSIVFYRRHSRE